MKFTEEQIKSGELLCLRNSGRVVRAASEEGERDITFNITTETEDRYGDVVSASGGRFENFLKNPVVLAFHNSRAMLPIARATSLTAYPLEKRVESTARFGDEETLGEWGKTADSFYKAYKNGFMSAVSIGFYAKDYVWDKLRGGFLITDWELVEYSAVPIPANPDALATQRALVAELRAAYEQVLDASTPSPQRAAVEAARAALPDAERRVLVRLNPVYRLTL